MFCFLGLNKLLLKVLLVVELTGVVVCDLQCFFCAGTGSHMPCDKHDPYVRSAECRTEEFRKNCTEPFDKMCTIETHYSMGGPLVQIRDCNDGNAFYLRSYNFTDPKVYDRLTNLQPNNETACVWDGINLVCLSKCDTDFCNGPQLDMQTCGSNVPLTSAYMYMILTLLTLHVIGYCR